MCFLPLHFLWNQKHLLVAGEWRWFCYDCHCLCTLELGGISVNISNKDWLRKTCEVVSLKPPQESTYMKSLISTCKLAENPRDISGTLKKWCLQCSWVNKWLRGVNFCAQGLQTPKPVSFIYIVLLWCLNKSSMWKEKKHTPLSNRF